jgi:hypothetical protein
VLTKAPSPVTEKLWATPRPHTPQTTNPINIPAVKTLRIL